MIEIVHILIPAIFIFNFEYIENNIKILKYVLEKKIRLYIIY